MITPQFLQMMAQYNQWQNQSILAAADTLSEVELHQDRGAFFRSIFGTLNHILWADKLWLNRFSGSPKPSAESIPDSVNEMTSWAVYKQERKAFDALMRAWADGLQRADLIGDLSWYSGAMGKDITKPRHVLMVHMFNHGTHHRGQVHGMLTSAGAKPDDTDLPFMP